MSDRRDHVGPPGATSTDAVHAGTPRARPRHALAPAVEQTATFTFDDTEDLVRFHRGEDPDADRQEYGRYGNPTTGEVEARLAALEGTDAALLFSSGMAALTTTALALCAAGDHVVALGDCYRRTRQLFGQLFSRFGVEASFVPGTDLAAVRAALRPTTRLVACESPSNPHLGCVDLEALGAIGRSARGLRTLVDATFATPVNCRPAAFGVDLVVHSATKYLAGHNDVLAGVVTGPTHLVALVRDARDVAGCVADPHAAFLVGRGMKTLALRVERQNATALEVARRLEEHPAVERVFYPGLSSHPTHAVARAQMRGFGGVVSFVVRGGGGAARRFVDGCRLARIAPSLGGVETLVEQPAAMSWHDLEPEVLRQAGIEEGLVRLAVGIEEFEDVWNDVRAALA